MILIREHQRTQRKICPSATLSTANFTWAVMGMILGLCGKNPATNHMCFGTATALTLFVPSAKIRGKFQWSGSNMGASEY
jgi:hypothetical protein